MKIKKVEKAAVNLKMNYLKQALNHEFNQNLINLIKI